MAGTYFAFVSLGHGSTSIPTIGRAAVVLDVAKREALVRAVRASGELLPDRVSVLATNAEGIVSAINVRAGSRVEAGTIVATIDNPDLAVAVEDARGQLVAARAELRSARDAADASRLDIAAAYRSALADERRANEESRADERLIADGIISTLVYREATIKASETHDLAQIAERKIAVDAAGEAAKVAYAQAVVDRAAASLAAARARAETLVVRAVRGGVVQTISVDVGQRVAPGSELARIAGERDLKAVLQVAEGDMHGVDVGLPVAIETNGSGALTGRVARIAPVAVNGSVAVDVALDGFHSGIRPSQSVDGTIELFRIGNALTIARPAGKADESTIDLFRVDPRSARASRTRVRLGTGSLDRVEVRSGLAPGDTVIVSDTSAFADASTIQITEP
jgi:RND family efflux transporter MFP subunit